jgi:hypothetical protein
MTDESCPSNNNLPNLYNFVQGTLRATLGLLSIIAAITQLQSVNQWKHHVSCLMFALLLSCLIPFVSIKYKSIARLTRYLS